MNTPDLTLALATRSRLTDNRPSGYLTRTLQRLHGILPPKTNIIVMDASPPGETHDELHAFHARTGDWMTVRPRPRPPVRDDEARALIPAARLATLPEEEITWGVQITRDFVDLMRMAAEDKASCILRIEDDVYAAKDLVSSAIQAIQRHPNRPFVSLFSPRIRLDGQTTTYHCHAQAIIFRNDSTLIELIRHVESLDGQNLFDVLMATFQSSSGHHGIVSYPSLVQHLGVTRSQPGSPPREPLVSPTFRSQPPHWPLLRPIQLAWKQMLRWLAMRADGQARYSPFNSASISSRASVMSTEASFCTLFVPSQVS